MFCDLVDFNSASTTVGNTFSNGFSQIPDFENLKQNYEIIHKLVEDKKALSVATVRQHGIAETVIAMLCDNLLHMLHIL